MKLADIITRSCLEQQWNGKAKQHMTQNDSNKHTQHVLTSLIYSSNFKAKLSSVVSMSRHVTNTYWWILCCAYTVQYLALLVSSDLELTYTFISQLETVKTAWACIS